EVLYNKNAITSKSLPDVEICEETLEERPIGPEKSLLDVSNDRDSGYECDFKDVYDNDEDDSQSEDVANALKGDDGFSDDDDEGYYYDLNTGETYTKSDRRYSISAY
ncbi:240_t:CDS:1, partial [Funneliformis caledonium]